ncbi:hypothetical protein HU200_058888 [Digitaria exilis]|uniref:DUF4220 domain-containing protein n=1 Tax=Digitaria exilis TaxID=1010633 RepID=A0A835E1N8_9POAL|nr:hypothetical protein HU200_058888 [Digitaria exilis]
MSASIRDGFGTAQAKNDEVSNYELSMPAYIYPLLMCICLHGHTVAIADHNTMRSTHSNFSMGTSSPPLATTIRSSLDPLAFFRAHNQAWCYEHTRPPSDLHNSQHAGDSMKTMELVFTVVLMALMGSTLYVDGFLRLFVPRFTHTMRLFLGRFNLEPIARMILHFAFLQFLPLLTSMFSQAGQGGKGEETEVLLMLLWMLLVEIIRKKVQGIMLPTNGSSFSRGIGRFTLMDYSDEFSRLVWVGFLIYTTLGRINYHSLDGVFITLWLLGLVKLVQRVVNTRLASASWHTARNPLLIAGYMQHVMEEEEKEESRRPGPRDDDDDDFFDMSRCKFVVMGEERLVRDSKKREVGETLKVATTPGYGYGVGRRIVPAPRRKDGHSQQGQGGAYCDQNEQKHVHVHLLIDRSIMVEPNAKKKGSLVTVGDIWKMHNDYQKLFSPKRRKTLEDLCLSFSLFKMLRRRFEHYPMVEVGSARTRKVMLHGLLSLQGDERDRNRNQRPFQVLQMELDILTNYYQQAAAPVVMSQPILFVCNFIWSIIFLVIFMAAVLYILIQSQNAELLYCAALGWVQNKSKSFLLYIYLCITMLLLLTVIFIEAYEFWTLYVYSNWNIVRLLCSYSRIRSVLRRNLYFLIISVRFCAQSSKLLRWFTKTNMKVQQVSIVDACGPLDKYSARATPKQLPPKATSDIIKTLKDDVDLDTGIVPLPLLGGLLSGWETTTTSTEIILACHLATELLDMTDTDHRHMTQEELHDKEVASVLSKYCMYLVAHVPQVLPDEETWVADRHEDVRSSLEKVSKHYCGIIFCAPGHECRKQNAMRILEKREEDTDDATTRRGLRLFRELENKQQAARSGRGDPRVWKDLASFWVSLVVYLAPSNDVQGHARALATWGSDLITCLWAFCTHAGITRQPLDYNDGVDGVCASWESSNC